MTCPYCGGPMQHGEIAAGHPVLRWFPGEAPRSKKSKLLDLGFGGKLLSAPSFAARLSIPADFCPKCKKMIFDTEILEP